MSVGGTRAACVPRPVITRRAPTSAPVPLASPWPLMARTVKVHPFALAELNRDQSACEECVVF